MPFNLPPLDYYSGVSQPDPAELTPPPVDDGDEWFEPDLWTGLKARLHYAGLGQFGKAFSPEKVRVPEAEQSWASHIPGVGAVGGLLNVLRTPQGLASNLYRRSLGVEQDAPFDISDVGLTTKVDWSRPYAPPIPNIPIELLYSQAVDAWKQGDQEKAIQLLQEAKKAGGFVGGAQKAIAGLGTDPAMAVGFGTGALGKAVGTGIIPELAEGAIRGAKEWGTQAWEKGITSPEAMSNLPEFLVSGGMLGLVGKHRYDARKVNAKLAADIEGAKADQARTSLEETLRTIREEDAGFASTEGLELRDIPDVGLPEPSARKVEVMLQRVLAEANAEMASGRLVEEGLPSEAVGPSGVLNVRVVPGNVVPTADGTPIEFGGVAVRAGDTIYVTKRGALSVLQAKDSAEALTRAIDLVAHELPHETVAKVMEGLGPTQDPMTGRVLSPQEAAQASAAAGHAPGGLYDDQMRDVQHLFIEEGLKKALQRNPTLQEWAGQAEQAGWLRESLQPRSDIPPTAGTYLPGLLSAVRGSLDLPTYQFEAAEAMQPAPALQGGGGFRAAIDALRRGWGKRKKEAETAGVGDPRFASALKEDLIRQDIRTSPLGLRQPEEIRPLPAVAKPAFPDQLPTLGLRSKALLGEKVSVPERFKATKEYMERIKKPLGERGRFGKWSEVLGEMEQMIKEGGGNIRHMREMGIEVKSLHNLVNSLRVAADTMAKQGNPEGAAELRRRVSDLVRKAPRATGFNERNIKVVEGVATERQTRAQESMEAKGARKPTKREERQARRFEKLVAVSEKSEKASKEATETLKRFVAQVRELRKSPTSGAKADALLVELSGLASELKGKRLALDPNQRRTFDDTLQSVVTEATRRKMALAKQAEPEVTEVFEPSPRKIVEGGGGRRRRAKLPLRKKPTGEDRMALDQPKLRYSTMEGVVPKPSIKKRLSELRNASRQVKRAATAAYKAALDRWKLTPLDIPPFEPPKKEAMQEFAERKAYLATEPSAKPARKKETVELEPALTPKEYWKQSYSTARRKLWQQRLASEQAKKLSAQLKKQKKVRLAAEEALARGRRAAEAEARTKPEVIKARLAARPKPYAGQRLEELGPSELTRRKELSAKLAEATKEPLKTAAYSEREGITISGKKVEGKIRVKLAPMSYKLGEWAQDIARAIHSPDPHLGFAQTLEHDLNALKHLKEAVEKVQSGEADTLPVKYETLKKFGFSAATTRQLRRMWEAIPKLERNKQGSVIRVVPMEERVAQYHAGLDSFLKHSAWDTLGVGTFAEKGERYLAVSRRTSQMRRVPRGLQPRMRFETWKKLRYPEGKEVIGPGGTLLTSRLRNLVRLSKIGKIGNLLKDYLVHLREGKQNPAPLHPAEGPYGGRREDRYYTVEVEHDGKKHEEVLLTKQALLDRMEKALPGVPRKQLERDFLSTIQPTPGTGRHTLYSYTEALMDAGRRLQTLADRIGLAAEKRGNEKAMAHAMRLAEFGAKLEPSRFKVLSAQANKKMVDVTTLMKEGKELAPLEYHSFEQGTGVPTSLHPGKPGREPYGAQVGKSPHYKPPSDVAMAVDEALKTTKGMSIIKPFKESRGIKFRTTKFEALGKPSKEVIPPGTVDLPVVRGARVREAGENQSRVLARLLASKRVQDLLGKNQATVRKLREEGRKVLADSFDLLDNMVSSLGLDTTGENRIARLHTKQAIWNMERNRRLKAGGPAAAREWAKKNPFSTFRPELHYNDFFESPAWEKWDTYINDTTGEAARPRTDVAGEYYLDRGKLNKWKSDQLAAYVTDKLREVDAQFDEYVSKAMGEERKVATQKERLAKLPDVIAVPWEKKALQRPVDTKALLRNKLAKAQQAAWKEGKKLTSEEARNILNPPPSWESPRAKAEKLFPKLQGAGARRQAVSGSAYEAPPETLLDELTTRSYERGFNAVRNRPTVGGARAKAWLEEFFEKINFTRPLRVAADVSAPFRNTWQLTMSHIVRNVGKLAKGEKLEDSNIGRNFLDMLRAYKSKEFYQNLSEALEADQYYKAGRRWGLKYATESNQLESFLGKSSLEQLLNASVSGLESKGMLGKAAALAPKGVKWVVDGAERSYVYWMNKEMRDAFKHSVEFMNAAKRLDPTSETFTDQAKFDDAVKSMVHFINNAASRSKVREGWMPDKGERGWSDIILNGLFYSAQMQLARLKFLGNVFDVAAFEKQMQNEPVLKWTGEGLKLKLGKEWAVRLEPGFTGIEAREARSYARKQALNALVGGMAGVGVIYTAGQLLGLDPTIETDPRSTDFMKVRMGPVSWDGWGGHQQFIRVGAQVALAERKEIGSGKILSQQPLDTMTKFVRSKLGPGAQVLVDLLQKRTGSGESFDPEKDPVGFASTLMKNLFMPMSFEDIGSLVKSDPRYGFLIPFMLLGNGVSAGMGAKEAWLAERPGLRERDVALSKELRAQGVTGPRLSHKVTLPGKDIYGKRKYYNLTPGEVKEFEREYMPVVTDLLYNMINSPAYQALPANKRPAALTRMVHRLNVLYGASARKKGHYVSKYLAGKVKPSGAVSDAVREAEELREAEFLERARESTGKMEAF